MRVLLLPSQNIFVRQCAPNVNKLTFIYTRAHIQALLKRLANKFSQYLFQRPRLNLTRGLGREQSRNEREAGRWRANSTRCGVMQRLCPGVESFCFVSVSDIVTKAWPRPVRAKISNQLIAFAPRRTASHVRLVTLVTSIHFDSSRFRTAPLRV